MIDVVATWCATDLAVDRFELLLRWIQLSVSLFFSLSSPPLFLHHLYTPPHLSLYNIPFFPMYGCYEVPFKIIEPLSLHLYEVRVSAPQNAETHTLIEDAIG